MRLHASIIATIEQMSYNMKSCS